jgi:hypothetical protein
LQHLPFATKLGLLQCFFVVAQGLEVSSGWKCSLRLIWGQGITRLRSGHRIYLRLPFLPDMGCMSILSCHLAW